MHDPDLTPRTSALDAAAEGLADSLRKIADRYALRRRAGQGGWGVVWEAWDALDGRRVAVKRYPALAPQEQLRVQREIEALNLLKIPGVVQMLDHGRDADGLYLVMAWVEGAPFPPGGWTLIGPTALALLRTLIAIHDAGVIHRDIKPANVLVRPCGTPVLVDFGLATGAALDLELTAVGAPMGTPTYRAPEQVRGDPVDGRADVYALGVMLYEALSGSPPHSADTEAALTEARLLRPPAPLRGPGLDVPGAVADVIAAMLRLDPADRWTARQALLALSGERGCAATSLPRLGPRDPLHRVVRALRQGRVVSVGGRAGSGRTRLLEDVAREMGGGVWLARGERPFSSVPRLAAALDPALDGEAARARIAQELAAPGLPVLGDDWAQVDAWTRALLEREVPPSGLVRVVEGAGTVTLAPLTAEDLLPLFEGPDRVLHSREDPARLLIQHTGGLPARVEARVRAWVRRGVLEATEAGLYRMRREHLDALSGETPLPDGLAELGLPPPLLDLLGWIRFCAPHSRRDVVCRVAGLTAWEFDLLAAALVAAGGADWDEDALVPRADAALILSEESRAVAHGALAEAIPLGAPGRLRHLVAAGRLDALMDEAVAASAREEAAGRLGPALAAVETARRLAPDGARLEGNRIRLLLAQGTADAAQQAAFLARTAGDARMEALTRGVVLARSGRHAEAAEILDALPAFSSDPRLEMARLGAAVQASRRLDLAQQERMLGALASAPVITGDPANRAQWAGWMGLLRYQQGRYAEAAHLHARAALGRPPLGRLTSLLNAGRAWLEANGLSEAEAVAREALALAAAARSPLREAEAEWILRSIANRRGATTSDLGLVGCAEALGDPPTLALIALTEGFIAWRGGRGAEAAGLALLAERSFAAYGQASAVSYAAALGFAAAGVGDPGAIAAAILAGVPAIALDALALLAGAGADIAIPEARRAALRLAVSPETRAFIRGAYPPSEALALLGLLPRRTS